MMISNSVRRGLNALLVGLCVGLILGTAVDKLWFREDDIGTIMHGLVESPRDCVHLMTRDDRDCICPINYRRSNPNVLSGFLRPLQHIVFTVIYRYGGLDPYLFFLVHLVIHLAGVMLLYRLAAYCMRDWIAVLCALWYGLYPELSWLTWAATMQNSLCNLFLIATVYAYARFVQTAWRGYTWLGGGFFLLSLLSRENGIMLPCWAVIVLGAVQYGDMPAIRGWLKACRDMWPLIAAELFYWMARFYAFGLGTLSRTIRNLALRVPWIGHLVHAPPMLTTSSGSCVPGGGDILPGVDHGSVAGGFVKSVVAACQFVADRLFVWIGSLVMIDHQTASGRLGIVLVVLIGGVICWLGYRYCRREGMFLFLGLVMMAWPGVVAYPCPRYLNSVYPFLAVFLFRALHNLIKRGYFRMATVATTLACVSIGYGALHNRYAVRDAAERQVRYKKPFDELDASYHDQLCAVDRIMVVGTPFLSDIQSILQVYADNPRLEVVHEPFATLAESGIFGCRDPYRIHDVASVLTGEDRSEGLYLHFKSFDVEHCGWWLHFSDHPLRWDAQSSSFVWTDEPYREGVWYPCSVGTFRIQRFIRGRYIAEAELLVNKRWISQKTSILTWDTMKGAFHMMPIESSD